MLYAPFFLLLGSLPFGLGVMLGVRAGWYFFVAGSETFRVPSLISDGYLSFDWLSVCAWSGGRSINGANRRLSRGSSSASAQIRSRSSQKTSCDFYANTFTNFIKTQLSKTYFFIFSQRLLTIICFCIIVQFV